MNAEQLRQQQNAYRKGRPSRFGRGIGQLTNPVGHQLAGMVPKSFTKTILAALDKAAPKEALGTFDHDTSDLSAAIDAAKQIERKARRLNALSGAGAGFAGALTASADIPATIALALANIRDTGRAYGFDGEGKRERLFRLQILEISAMSDRTDRLAQLDKLEADITPDGSLAAVTAEDIEPVIDQVVERVSRALAFAAFRSRAGMIVPLIGSAVGGFVNAQFQTDVSKAARYAFQARRLAKLETGATASSV
ncbi:MAG: EcsC family protein [Erythrobacter sp.]